MGTVRACRSTSEARQAMEVEAWAEAWAEVCMEVLGDSVTTDHHTTAAAVDSAAVDLAEGLAAGQVTCSKVVHSAVGWAAAWPCHSWAVWQEVCCWVKLWTDMTVAMEEITEEEEEIMEEEEGISAAAEEISAEGEISERRLSSTMPDLYCKAA